MRCAAEPLCHMCLAWDHQCWRDSPQEDRQGGTPRRYAVEEQTFAHPVGLYAAAPVYAVDRNGRCYPATLQPGSSSDVPQVTAPIRARVPGFPSAVDIPVPSSSASSSATVHSTVPTQPLGPGGVVSPSSSSDLAPAPSLPPYVPSVCPKRLEFQHGNNEEKKDQKQKTAELAASSGAASAVSWGGLRSQPDQPGGGKDKGGKGMAEEDKDNGKKGDKGKGGGGGAAEQAKQAFAACAGYIQQKSDFQAHHLGEPCGDHHQHHHHHHD